MLSVEVVLTPTESKRILSKAVLSLDHVRKALQDGILIIHPSSTTIFMLDELGFDIKKRGIWVCGHMSPRGLCMSRKMIDVRSTVSDYTPDKYPFDFILRKGQLAPFEESGLGAVLAEMKANDVYVKSVNALDPEGRAGVLLAARSTGGSIGLVLQKQKSNGFKLVIPVGLEKRIPISINEATKAAIRAKHARGIPCNLWRIHGEIITEIDAFRRLCGVDAVPISAGGVCGAEGSILWVITGEDENVRKACELCEQVHGHEFPYSLEVYECKQCPYKSCNLAGKEKWQLPE